MINSLISVFGPPPASNLKRKDQWLALLASFVAMLVVVLVNSLIIPDFQHLLVVASLGATVVLVFVVPNSPFSQPYTLLMGHFLGAVIGVACAYLPLDLYLSTAIAISLCIFAMFLTGSMHPPAGATTMMPIIIGADEVGHFYFVLFPVMSNIVLLLLLALIIHRYWLKKEYPSKPTPTSDPIHKHKDASPLVRLGLQPSDLHGALQEIGTYLDISEQDLTRVYGLAQQRAYTRKFGEIRCKHIMSRDVISVTPTTTLEDAWALLRGHKIKVLPVLDTDQEVVGIISLVDFVKRAHLKGFNEMYGQLEDFVKGDNQSRPPLVREIMVTPVFSVNEYDLIAQIVPLLSDQGMHHVPVLNEERQMTGIITQSDLIAALYSSSANLEVALEEQGNS